MTMIPLRVAVSTVSNRTAHIADLDAASDPPAALYQRAADALDLAPATLKLNFGRKQLPATAAAPMADTPAFLNAIGVSRDALVAGAAANGGQGYVLAVSAVGLRRRIAASTPSRETSMMTLGSGDVMATGSSFASNAPGRADVATNPGSPMGSPNEVHVTLATPAAPRTRDAHLTSPASNAPGTSPRMTATSPGVIPVPLPEALQAVIARVEAAPTAPRKRRAILQDPVIDNMGTQVRDAPDPEAALRSLIERIHQNCPAFVEKVIRPHQRDFLDAMNGVAATITIPLLSAMTGASGGGGQRLSRDTSGDHDEDGDDAIVIPGDQVGPEALMQVLSQAILAEIANAAAGGGLFEYDESEAEDSMTTAPVTPAANAGDGAAAAMALGPGVVHGSPNRKPTHLAKEAKEIALVNRELDSAAAIWGTRNFGATAAHYHNAWCRLRKLYTSLLARRPAAPFDGSENTANGADNFEGSVSSEDMALSATLVEVRSLMTRCILQGTRAINRALRSRLDDLVATHFPSANAAASPNSPNRGTVGRLPTTGVPSTSVVTSTGADNDSSETGRSGASSPQSRGATLQRLDEHQHNNAVLAALDEALLMDAIGAAAQVTFVGPDPAELDEARALALHLLHQDLREVSDIIFGLLELTRPVQQSGGSLRALHGGIDSAPFGTGTHSPKALVEAAKRFLEDRVRGYGSGGAGAASSSGTSGQYETGPASTPTSATEAALLDGAAPDGDECGLADYEALVARLVRQCQDENFTCVVYGVALQLLDKARQGSYLSPFLSLQDYLAGRFSLDSAHTAPAFAVTPTARPDSHRRIAACQIQGAAAALATGVTRLAHAVTGGAASSAGGPGQFRQSPAGLGSVRASTGDGSASWQRNQANLACEGALSELSSLFLGAVAELLPPPAKPHDDVAPRVAFVPLQLSDRAFADALPEAIAAVPFHAFPLPRAAQPDAGPRLRVIDVYSPTICPSVPALLQSWTAAECPRVRAKVRGGASIVNRPPWLTAAAARTLQVRGLADRSQHDGDSGGRWTLLTDTSAPRDKSGTSADLFIATTADPAAARATFFSRSASTALVTLWRDASDMGRESPVPGQHQSPEAGASPSSDSSEDSDSEGAMGSPVTSGPGSPAGAPSARDVAKAFRIAVVRHMLETLCTSTAPVTVADAFRRAVLATRAAHPETAAVSWAPHVLLHSGRGLEALRLHVLAIREDARARLASTRARVAVRGPLSATESRNVRYVQQHDVPGLIDVLCRELLATRPQSEAGVLDTLIAALEQMERAQRRSASPPRQHAANAGSTSPISGPQGGNSGAGHHVPHPPPPRR